MKKILVSLVVLAMAVPTMAATVDVVDNADGTATITVTSESDPIVGLGLDIDVTGGNITELSMTPATFNIYPDAAQAAGTGYEYGDGTAIADQDAAGELELPLASFAVSAGMLNGSDVPGADGAMSVVITVAVDADVDICVSENAIRGGIVLTTGVGEDITNGTDGVVCESIVIGDQEAVKNTASFYQAWVDWGRPDCWAYAKNCNGDADGVLTGPFRVANPDLQTLIGAFNKPDAMVPAGGICADFDHAATGPFRVANPDLQKLIQYFNKPDAMVPECDNSDYNFWKDADGNNVAF